jgi:hypothetical protein
LVSEQAEFASSLLQNWIWCREVAGDRSLSSKLIFVPTT